MTKQKSNFPWTWIPTLYFAEGLPYVAVMTIACIMYKKMELSNTDIALYTSWLYLPWVIKPIWSPFVDILRSKRWWIVITQLLIGVSFACVAFTLNIDHFFQWSLAFFCLVAFSSATHDIAADGFYMLGLDEKQQSFFVGIRNTFYRIAMLTGQGLLVMLAGMFENKFHNIPFAWSLVFLLMAILFVVLSFYHKKVLPHPSEDNIKTVNKKEIFKKFSDTFVTFFQKKGIIVAILFLLTYRLAESQLSKIASLFMLDSIENGGLALSTQQVGFIYGTLGVAALVVGGILGGMAVSRNGFYHWIWPMALALNLPDLTYLYLSFAQPDQIILVYLSVAVEQFGYGFGFTAYTIYMLSFAEGKSKTAHYAICTAFMAIGMMLPGMIAGWIQEMITYKYFFIWIIVCSIPGFTILPFLKVNVNFGEKEEKRSNFAPSKK